MRKKELALLVAGIYVSFIIYTLQGGVGALTPTVQVPPNHHTQVMTPPTVCNVTR